MIVEEIRRELFANADEVYKRFHGSLVPNQSEDTLIGVRVPVLRKLAKRFAKREDVGDFLADLPHVYYEENALHGYVIGEIRDFSHCMAETERFLPYISNWAVCDCLSPKVFAKEKPLLFEICKSWLQSDHTYTVRFGLVMLLKHFLETEYVAETLALGAAVDSEEYYINMAAAWLFAEAMAKCPEAALPYFEKHLLNARVHNKAIQKAVESFRVSEETKSYLKSLKRKNEL